jgi:cytochrome c oxidase cbb3-type subunit 3
MATAHNRASPPRGRGSRGARVWPIALACVAALAACQREDRNLSAPPEDAPQSVALSDLRPGPPAPPPPDDPRGAIYDGNATRIANGQRYFTQFNCNGCHFNGGGGIGPALMDDKWRYGGKPEQIVDSILRGRPNGMPAFQDKVPAAQAWELAAYIRSLSGNADKLAAPSRPDAMRSIPPINNIDRQPPKSDPAATRVGGT